MFVALYRCVPMFKAVEQLKNLHVDYKVLSRSSFNSPINFGLCFTSFAENLICIYCFILGYHEYNTLHIHCSSLEVNVLD